MKTIEVILYTIPQAACGANKTTWADVAGLLQSNLVKSFSEVQFRHTEFMSEAWFADEQAQHFLETQLVSFPFVLVNGEIACIDKKVNISKVRKFIQNLKEQ